MRTFTVTADTTGEQPALRITSGGNGAGDGTGAGTTARASGGVPDVPRATRQIVETLLSQVDGELRHEDGGLVLTFRGV
jgi:hypothetical protein